MTHILPYPGKKVCAVGIIVHHPETPEAQKELAKRVAQVHAQTVVERIKSISCPIEQKAELIDAVKRIYKKEAGA